MSSATAADEALRSAITLALQAAGRLPLSPLIEIVVSYALPFRSVVTTIGGANPLSTPFKRPVSVMVDPTAPASYLVVDSSAHCIQRLCHATGVATILAGDGYDPGRTCGAARTAARFYAPVGLAVDPRRPHTRFYVCDSYTVRVWERGASDDATGGVVSLLAGIAAPDDHAGPLDGYSDGSGLREARFDALQDIVCSSDGAMLIVSDMRNNRLRAIDTQTGVVSTVAGDGNRDTRAGKGVNASLASPKRMAASTGGGVLYVATLDGIARFEPFTGDVSVIKAPTVGWGTSGLAVLPNGWLLYASIDSHALYTLDPNHKSPQLQRIAGADSGVDGVGGGRHLNGFADGHALEEAEFDRPDGLCVVQADRSLLVADSGNGLIRRVTLPSEWFDRNRLISF